MTSKPGGGSDALSLRLYRHYERVPESARGAVVTIGNFDGIHRGHQSLIAKAGRLAKEFDAPHGLVTFEPHPASVFKPDQPPFRLTSFRTKAQLLDTLGLDLLFALHFTRDFAKLTADDFARDVLAGGLKLRHVVVGNNFRFGNRALGDVALLEDLGRQYGFGVTAVPLIQEEGTAPYSSSLVRHYLKEGNPTRAALVLGRYFEIEGRVRHGAKRGRDLGYPTANLSVGRLLRPAYGVYAVRVSFARQGETKWLPAVANFGINPMFELDEPLLEVHLFDFDGDLYGRHLRVALVDYLRPEQKFDSLDALKAQMAEDSRRARETLSWEAWDAAWPAGNALAKPAEPDGGQ